MCQYLHRAPAERTAWLPATVMASLAGGWQPVRLQPGEGGRSPALGLDTRTQRLSKADMIRPTGLSAAPSSRLAARPRFWAPLICRSLAPLMRLLDCRVRFPTSSSAARTLSSVASVSRACICLLLMLRYRRYIAPSKMKVDSNNSSPNVAPSPLSAAHAHTSGLAFASNWYINPPAR